MSLQTDVAIYAARFPNMSGQPRVCEMGLQFELPGFRDEMSNLSLQFDVANLIARCPAFVFKHGCAN